MLRSDYETIRCELRDPVLLVTFSRPEVHNAFNDKMISELLEVFRKVGQGDGVRVVVLTGEGKSFCAGADLNWMKRVMGFSFEENLKESLELAELMHSVYSLQLPTIAMVNGAAIGGGMGFVATCDIVVAASHAKFSLSEVKLGLVPACISPYVIRKAGEAACREFMLTGERLTAEKAARIGLVNDVVEASQLESTVSAYVDKLVSSGPNAIAICKQLLREVPAMALEEAKRATAESLAHLRVSEEGQEGMKAFLEKRKPRWLPKK
ncbi:MAG: enoyl-CoA hydratase/isomerase family protein [Candidatus Eiseniibacteriota bacterium]|nr:MAG: enoyl-CoA hydratase/isomerase family protein [Candidatus Eisenbacteria bacterium]